MFWHLAKKNEAKQMEGNNKIISDLQHRKYSTNTELYQVL